MATPDGISLATEVRESNIRGWRPAEHAADGGREIDSWEF